MPWYIKEFFERERQQQQQEQQCEPSGLHTDGQEAEQPWQQPQQQPRQPSSTQAYLSTPPGEQLHPEHLMKRATSAVPTASRPVVHMYAHDACSHKAALAEAYTASSSSSSSGSQPTIGALALGQGKYSEYRAGLSSRKDSPAMHIEARHKQVRLHGPKAGVMLST
jgi:hypothetical protein